jgi:energy-coupling factor transporter ATP-binding protein EcfA2
MKSPFSSSRAYLIGVANYQHTPWQLATPLRDAEALAEVLRAQHGFETTLLADPTAAQMQAFFSQILAENPAEDARILIYYAGHGVQRDSANGLQGYFMPSDARPGDDASMVPMEAISDALRTLPARHLLLVLDCCFAGTFRMPAKRSIGFDSLSNPLRRQHFDIFCNFPSRLVLSSTSHRQKALDRLEDGDANSPFNRFLRQAIGGEADYTRDRLVTATELKTYLADSVSQVTGFADNLQSVGLDALEGDGEGEFLFFLDGFEVAQLPEQAYINPYKGLQSYESGDAALFFGRQKATQNLLAKVQESSFVIVVGASGTGKSSLVKAGLLPRLSGQRISTIRPGKNPMAVLPAADHWDVLVVDQWEELITQATDATEVERFYAEIRRLLDAGKRIIGTVRADFEAQARHDTLESDWSKGRFVVPPFSSEEYHDVIVQPAKRVACLFEDRDLVQQIEQEVAQQPGPLPLLSFMLSELFERAKGESARYREIKRRHYEAVGGVSGALRNKAEEVFAALPDPAHRDTMRRLMLRMVALSAGEMAGRRVLLPELDFHDGAEDKRIESTIQQLDEAKLIRRDADDAGRRFIEPAHDALVRAWKRLWDWVRELGEENLLLHAKLSAAVGDYQAQQSNKTFLWTADPRLEQAQQLLKNEPLLFNQAERNFVETSVVEKKRRARRTRMIALAVGAAILAAAVLAWVQRNQAQQNLDNFVKADAERIEQERQKERGNFDKHVRDGDTYVNSGEYDLAFGKYRKADSILLKFPDDAALRAKAATLRGKLDSCQTRLDAATR